MLALRRFDVVLLDIILPMREGESPKVDGGVEVLDYVLTSASAKRPRYVIGMSAEASALASVSGRFLQSMFTIFERRVSDASTSGPLTNFVKYLVSQQASESAALEHAGLAPVPLAIVCAVAEEFRALGRIFDLPKQELSIAGDPTTYFAARLEGSSGTHNVVVAQAAEQGMPVAAALVSKIICRFRPRYVAMPGIAAGLSEYVQFGDVIVAEQTWDYTTGKLISEDAGTTKVRAENRSLRADPTVMEQMRRLASDHQFMAAVRDEWPAEAPKTQLALHAGPIASGGAVVEDGSIRKAVLERDRKTLGLDMEAHAVAVACWYSIEPRPSFIIAKGVVDHAVPPKTNKWQPYASYASARVLKEWARRFL
jgi:nucleoside phosphorylase